MEDYMKPNNKQSLHNEDNQIMQAGNDFMKTNCKVKESEGQDQLLGEDKDLVDSSCCDNCTSSQGD